MRKISWVIGFAACLLIGWQVQAVGPHHMMKRVLIQLALSDTQMDEIEKLHFSAEREMIEIRHKLDQARLELEQAFEASEPDKKGLFALIERVEMLEVEKKKNRLGLMLDIRALMTLEQWKKLETMQKARKVRHEH
ncbi:MAG: periplasmic heavy metal sensor [Deltaproteobacteria bacterium]|nr:periplasmic heavy metal sensor [Deltaproteobacteria bacterium]